MKCNFSFTIIPYFSFQIIATVVSFRLKEIVFVVSGSSHFGGSENHTFDNPIQDITTFSTKQFNERVSTYGIIWSFPGQYKTEMTIVSKMTNNVDKLNKTITKWILQPHLTTNYTKSGLAGSLEFAQKHMFSKGKSNIDQILVVLTHRNIDQNELERFVTKKCRTIIIFAFIFPWPNESCSSPKLEKVLTIMNDRIDWQHIYKQKMAICGREIDKLERFKFVIQQAIIDHKKLDKICKKRPVFSLKTTTKDIKTTTELNEIIIPATRKLEPVQTTTKLAEFHGELQTRKIIEERNIPISTTEHYYPEYPDYSEKEQIQEIPETKASNWFPLILLFVALLFLVWAFCAMVIMYRRKRKMILETEMMMKMMKGTEKETSSSVIHEVEEDNESPRKPYPPQITIDAKPNNRRKSTSAAVATLALDNLKSHRKSADFRRQTSDSGLLARRKSCKPELNRSVPALVPNQDGTMSLLHPTISTKRRLFVRSRSSESTNRPRPSIISTLSSQSERRRHSKQSGSFLEIAKQNTNRRHKGPKVCGSEIHESIKPVERPRTRSNSSNISGKSRKSTKS